MADEMKVDNEATGLSPLGEITPVFMRLMFFDGVLGTKEFRAWLAEKDEAFKAVRDADVDNEIDRLARERREDRLAEEARLSEPTQGEFTD